MQIKGKTFLVTGGTGFIGGALVRALISRGAKVRSLDNDSRLTVTKGRGSEQAELIQGDIRDPEIVSRSMEGVDCVCHLAYINGTEYFYTRPQLVLDVAVKGMVNVLDAAMKHGVRDMVLASSSEVYQRAPVVPTDETVPLSVPDVLNPRYSYGGGKIISELMAINYGRTSFDRVSIFRPHNVYGPDMGWEHVIPQFAERMLQLPKGTAKREDFPIQGSGEETRSFVFISDMIEGVLKIIESGEHLGIYHVGTTEEVTIKSLALEIARQFGISINVVPGDLQEGGTPRRCPDITRISQLGYRPSVSLADGLALTLPWYSENLHLKTLASTAK